jgi:hypothetical protein
LGKPVPVAATITTKETDEIMVNSPKSLYPSSPDLLDRK